MIFRQLFKLVQLHGHRPTHPYRNLYGLSTARNLSLNTDGGPAPVSPTRYHLVIEIPGDPPHSQDMTPRLPTPYSIVAVVILMKLALVIPIALLEVLAR